MPALFGYNSTTVHMNSGFKDLLKVPRVWDVVLHVA